VTIHRKKSETKVRKYFVLLAVFPVLATQQLVTFNRLETKVWWVGCLSATIFSGYKVIAPTTSATAKLKSNDVTALPHLTSEKLSARGALSMMVSLIALLVLAITFMILKGRSQSASMALIASTPVAVVWYLCTSIALARVLYSTIRIAPSLLGRFGPRTRHPLGVAAEIPEFPEKEMLAIGIASGLAINVMILPLPSFVAIDHRGIASLYLWVLVIVWRSDLRRGQGRPSGTSRIRASNSSILIALLPLRASPKHARNSRKLRLHDYMTFALGIAALGLFWLSGFAGIASATTQVVAPVIRPAVRVVTSKMALSMGSNEGALQSGEAPPEQAILNGLWFTPGIGVGTGIGGRPEAVQENSNKTGTTYYEVGKTGNSLMSVGVSSTTFGSALFLSDGGAAQYVLSILERGIVLGGAARVNIGNGDLQELFDSDGTTLFIRPILHPTGKSSIPEPLIVLTPSQATGWLFESESLHQFLWPTKQLQMGSDQEMTLSRSPYGDTVATLVSSSDGTHVQLETRSGTLRLRTDTGQIPVSEIQSLPVKTG
jgi:hypothetical protein